MRSFALPRSISALHFGGAGIASGQMSAPEVLDFGMSNDATPPTADVPSALMPIVVRFSWRKFRPGRVTRTAAAFGTVWLFGNPPGSGVVPHDAQPLEQPPP